MKQTLKKYGFWILIVFLFACGKDDPKPALPTLTVSSDQIVEGTFKGIYYSGIVNPDYGRLTLQLTGTAPQGFSKLIISKVTDGIAAEVDVIEQNDVQLSASNTVSTEYKYDIVAADIGKTIQLKADLIDKKNNVTSIIVANIDVKRSMKNFELELYSDDLENDIGNNNYFLIIKPDASDIVATPSAHVMSYDDLNSEKNYGEVQLVFDYLHGQGIGGSTGFYFASPKATGAINSKLVSSLSVKNSTQVKIAEFNTLSPADAQKLAEIDNGNAHHLEEIFNKIPAGINPEIAYLNKATKYFLMFKLADGRVGYINEIILIVDKKLILFDLWISAK